MREEVARRDRVVAAIAARQHGVVTYAQLVGIGIDKSGVERRVRSGRLHRLHRGVYAVGHRALSWRGRWLAAVLAVGDGAVLSHTSAVALWQFLRPIPGPIHVTVRGGGGRNQRRGIVVHRSQTLASSHVTRSHGISVTNPARTISDVRGELEPHLFRRALRQAELAGHRVPHLGTTKRTRSDLELLFLVLCEDHGLPRPEVNARIGPRLVDFLFRDHHLAVETDSWDYHRGSVAFEDDHARDLALRAHGLEVRRYTGDQLVGAPDAVAADLRRALLPDS